MINFADDGSIDSFEEHTDENGERWYVVNQDTYYPIDRYTAEQAKADYQSPKSIEERADATYRAWCD